MATKWTDNGYQKTKWTDDGHNKTKWTYNSNQKTAWTDNNHQRDAWNSNQNLNQEPSQAQGKETHPSDSTDFTKLLPYGPVPQVSSPSLSLSRARLCPLVFIHPINMCKQVSIVWIWGLYLLENLLVYCFSCCFVMSCWDQLLLMTDRVPQLDLIFLANTGRWCCGISSDWAIVILDPWGFSL